MWIGDYLSSFGDDPAGGLEGEINEFSLGLGFVHGLGGLGRFGLGLGDNCFTAFSKSASTAPVSK